MTTATATKKTATPAWARKLGLNFSAREAKFITLTPEVTEKFLSLNTKNRDISKTNVEKMVRQIESGRFNPLTSNTIGISSEGRITDGQHRLTAFLQTGLTVDVPIITGCDPMAVLAPNGKPRSLGEYLKQNGYAYTAALAAMIKTLYNWEGPGAYDEEGNFNPDFTYGRNQTHITDDEYLDYLLLNPSLTDYVKLGSVVYERVNKALPPRFLGAFAYYVDHHTDENGKADREYFFDRLADGIGLEDGSPILALRDSLARRKENGDEKFGVTQGKFFKAWNAYRSGKAIARGTLRFKIGGANPEKMPTPV